MLMPLLKSTITKWHIFTPDFARRVLFHCYFCLYNGGNKLLDKRQNLGESSTS